VSPYTLGIAAGGVTNAMLSNSALTVSAGSGLTGGGSVSLGGTVTLSSTLGTDIDSSEIVNGTIATADIAASAITAALVSDGTLTTADLSATAGITNAQLANSSITVTAGAGLSGGGVVALGSSVTLTSTLGTAIDTTEITDGTILFADIAQNGCSNGQVLKYNTGWTCAADNDTTYTAGTGVSINGSNVISSTLGTDIDSSEIVDSTVALIDLAADSVNSSKIVNGSVANADLANSAVTITAGTGLSGGLIAPRAEARVRRVSNPKHPVIEVPRIDFPLGGRVIHEENLNAFGPRSKTGREPADDFLRRPVEDRYNRECGCVL
jgi:hypothetical protein